MKKVMICVDLTDESVNLMKKRLAELDLSSFDRIVIAHGFELKVFADNFHFATYPQQDHYEEIQEEVKKTLSDFIGKALPESLQSKAVPYCVISMSPKESLAEYATEEKVDRMIIGTRGKKGVASLFSSSFAEFMVRHAPCELMIIRE